MAYSKPSAQSSNRSLRSLVTRSMFPMFILVGFILAFLNAEALHAQPCSSTPVLAGYRDFSFGNTVIATPTAEKPESKLWHNDGFWWGSLWSTASNKYRIHRFNTASQCWENVGPDIDDRPLTLSDALWDGNKLYIASHTFSNNGSSTTAPNAARLYRYSYNSSTDSYTVDGGFPVTINLAKSEAMVLAKDSAGKLWITWTQGGKVKVNRSTTNDLTWGTTFDLPVQGGPTKGDDISSIIAFDGNKIGIMWSNQTDLKTYFAVHIDGNPDTQWEPREEALVDPSLGAVADDHINLKMTSDDGGNLYAVTKTSLSNLNHPLIYLLRRTSSGVWSRHVVGRKSDNHTRPIVLLDEENRRLYVFAKSDNGTNGTIRMKSASVDDLVFPTGLGDIFIRSTTDDDINNPTSTKQNLNGTTNLLVLASDKGTRNYMHNFIDLPGGGGGTQFTLTTNVTPTGSGTISPSGGTYNSGTQVQLTANASAGWVFDHWSVDLSGSTNPATVTMNSNKNVTATFVEQSGQFTLTTNTVGSGTVSLNPPGGSYNSGQEVTVTANASAGWAFSSWSGDLSGSINPQDITMNANKNVTATFTQVGGGGLIVHEETRTGGSSSLATVATSSSLTAAVDQLYLAAISTKPNIGVNSVTGLGLTWTQVDAQCAGRNQTRVEVWMAQGTPSGNGVVMATLANTTNNAAIAVSRYSGVDTNDPIGNFISGNTTGLNGSCAGGADNSSYSFNLTTTVNGSFAYGAAVMRSKTHTPGAGYTERGELMQGSGGSATSVAVMDKVVNAAGSVAVNGTFNGAVDWAMVGVEIKPQVSIPLTENLVAKDGLLAAAQSNEFQLHQNYPNPFNPTTMINYTLPAASPVRLIIYDMIGRTVAVLVDAMQNAGTYSQAWNGMDSQGRQATSGTYYYRLEAGANKQTIRMTLIR